MFKSKLQELCQRLSWELPEYNAVKDGPDHMPRFTATVNVHGQLFQTPTACRSSKEAQNTAAQMAFEHFSSNPPARPPSGYPSVPPPPSLSVYPNNPPPPALSVYPSNPPPPSPSVYPNNPPPQPQIQPMVSPDPVPLPLSPLPSSLPDPPLGLLATKYNVNTKEYCYNAAECSTDYKLAIGSEYKDTLHMYKNLLQQYAQKENLGFPVYTSEAEGPPHARRFKSKVSVSGKSYETSEFFSTLKEAEQAAAKIACQALSIDAIQEDKGLYKNLLQEFAQKKGLMCPSYETQASGLAHKPVFMSIVEIGSDRFKGSEAKTRKQAEMNAAKVAYYALTKGCPPTNSLMESSPSNCHFAENLSQNIQPTATIEKIQLAACPQPNLAVAGCPPTNSIMVSSVNSGSFPNNLSQDIQPTATEKKQAAAYEDGQQSAKRAKSVPENVNVSPHPHTDPPSSNSNMETSTATDSVSRLKVENKRSIQWKTVVFPRKSNRTIPENASVMPYSDEQWVAYRVEVDPKPTA